MMKNSEQFLILVFNLWIYKCSPSDYILTGGQIYSDHLRYVFDPLFYIDSWTCDINYDHHIVIRFIILWALLIL